MSQTRHRTLGSPAKSSGPFLGPKTRSKNGAFQTGPSQYQPLFFCFLRRNPLKRFRGSLLLVFCDCVLFCVCGFSFSFVSCGFLFFWCWCLRFSSLAFFLSHWYFPRKTPIKRFRVASSSLVLLELVVLSFLASFRAASSSFDW